MAEIKISEMTEATLPLDGTEDMEIVQAGVTRRCSTQDVADLGTSTTKVYAASLSASGTANPAATVMINGLSGAIVWTHSATGIYLGTLSGAFTVNKTSIFINSTQADCQYLLDVLSVNQVRITQKDLSGTNFDELFGNIIKIEVYP
jgi:hypothetical protein